MTRLLTSIAPVLTEIRYQWEVFWQGSLKRDAPYEAHLKYALKVRDLEVKRSR